MKVIAFMAGLGIGAAVAMLFAPRSGEETRELIGEKAQQGKRYVAARAGELREAARELRDAGRDAADEIVETGKETVQRQKEAVAGAVKAGKATYTRESHARPA
jgi:gas vesicle protein